MRFFSNTEYKSDEILIIGDTLHDLEIGIKLVVKQSFLPWVIIQNHS